ncbi:MAG: hypothetical protein J2P21_06855 [Chloracidobacterium sp.]|nr:hypothetical protein [Chloracidobacterium sp.]
MNQYRELLVLNIFRHLKIKVYPAETLWVCTAFVWLQQIEVDRLSDPEFSRPIYVASMSRRWKRSSFVTSGAYERHLYAHQHFLGATRHADEGSV